MNYLKAIIFTAFLFFLLPSFPQDKLKSKTLTIVDTSKTKIEQAHEIYSWITRHISYDVDAYLHGDYSYKSPSTILSKKKGICKDYSVLFNVMCYDIGIEAYTIEGYVLGPDFYKGDGFYRANHSWNVVHIDSVWFLADLTWGSGYLKHVPTALDQFKHRFLKTPVVNRRWVYVKSPEDRYFNPLDPTFGSTHLPLDPKWQLRKRPFTVQGFENGQFSEEDYQINLKEALQNAIGLRFSQQALLEGINGKAFNPKNDFDIGFGYLQMATEFNDQATPVDSLTKGLFDKSLANYKDARKYISSYHYVVDSVFKRRIALIKKEGAYGNKVVTTISHMIRSQKLSFVDNQNSLTKRYREISWRIDKYEYFGKLVSQRSYPIPRADKVKTSDSTVYCLNLVNYGKSSALSSRLSVALDSLIDVCFVNIVKDSVLAVKCLDSKQSFGVLAFNFGNQLVTEDNRLIFSYWDTIKLNFLNLMENFRMKRQNLTMIRSNMSKINEVVSLMTEELGKQVDFIRKMAKFSGDTLQAWQFMDLTYDFMREAFRKAKDISLSYLKCIDGLMDFNSSDYQINLSLSDSPVENLRLFVKYDDELYASQKRFYENEKTLLKEVLNQCNTGQKRIEKRLSVYAAQSAKKRK